MYHVDRRGFISTCGIALGTAAFVQPQIIFGADTNFKPENTLFLTWQQDPTTTMTAQWISDAATDSKNSIRYTEWSKELKDWRTVDCRTRPYPQTSFTMHRAEITGLKPGTEYALSTSADPTVRRFRTMPAKATNAISFISGGDCGINEHAVANNIQAAKQEPMFCVIGGDLGYDDGKNAETSLKFIRNYSEHMVDPLGRLIPMVVCIGNHEVQGGYNGPREKAPFFFAMHDGLFADTSYNVLDIGDYMSLVLLDTGHVSKIGGEQTSWLDKTLAAREACPNLLVFNHVPAYPSHRGSPNLEGDGTGGDNRKHWVPLFEKHNVDVVFEHHDHTFKRTKPLLNGHLDLRRGVTYLGDGSWGRIRALNEPVMRPYMAAWSSVYHMSLHRIEGTQRFHMAISDTGKVMDVCTTGKRTRSKVALVQ
ncbi:MAG: metallophosphoesterase family protein [Planctomycetota bacterium]|nr:metallophosphoesterase family protein [Planctomycetota bacterium]